MPTRDSVRLALLIGLVLMIGVPLMAAGDQEAGKQEFLDQGCNKCHPMVRFEIEAKIKSEKMKGPDLSEAGSKFEAEWMARYVLKEVQLNDRDHKGKWEGSKKELQAIVDWLAAQKADEQ